MWYKTEIDVKSMRTTMDKNMDVKRQNDCDSKHKTKMVINTEILADGVEMFK